MCHCSHQEENDIATVPNNVISGKETNEPTSDDGTNETAAGSADSEIIPTTKDPLPAAPSTTTESECEDSSISLHWYHHYDNIPFQAKNMFPGDSETKYFSIRVSYKETVTLCFHADIQPGCEKLSEVLMCRIVLLTTGQILYDGLMRDMPECLSHPLCSPTPTTEKLQYEITTYLDGSVGNEYQNMGFVANFRWWVQEEENLTPPQTGDESNKGIYLMLFVGSTFLIILLLKKLRREENSHGG